jgi:hypothetical protein
MSVCTNIRLPMKKLIILEYAEITSLIHHAAMWGKQDTDVEY